MKYYVSMVLLPLLLSSCLEIDTLNKINEDGSIDRTIELKGSAESLSKTGFNIPGSDSDLWLISLDSLEDDKLLYRASRHFDSVEELNKSYTDNTGEFKIKIKAELVKSEGLFFTNYRYHEKIWADLPGSDSLINDQEFAAEIKKLLQFEEDPESSSMDSVEAAELESRLENYLDQVIYADFIEEVLIGARRGGISQVIEPRLDGYKDSLMAMLKNTNYQDENPGWQDFMKKFISPLLVRIIWENNIAGFDHLYRSWQFFDNLLMDDFEFRIDLPGVIKKNNATDVQGNLLSWNPEAIFFFFGGVDLEAESSQNYLWGVFLTVVVILLALAVVIQEYKQEEVVPDN